MELECLAEGVWRGKAENSRNDMDADTATELRQRHFHTPAVKILLWGDVISFGKLAREIFAGVTELLAETVHIKGVIGETVEVEFDRVGNVGILFFLLTEL